jgi:Zn-dependent peptidase ImmA (M78 family)
VFEIARRLRIDVERVQLPPGVLGVSSRSAWAILYEESGYRPRDEFTVAHELMELHLPRPVLELPRAVKERFCDRGAAALLLPRGAFLRSLKEFGWNVEDQRQRWPYVSARVIAARIDECLRS